MKIGVAVITCNREHFLKKCLASIDITRIQSLVVVNDGQDLTVDLPFDLIKTKGKEGVGVSKNKAIKYLLDKDCDYVFLLEDDIFIKDNNVFNEYINTCNATGIQHFNYAFHGYYNLTQDRVHSIKCDIEYPSGCSISLVHNVLGAFSFYTRAVLEDVGLMDEKFYNAMEHVDHTYQIIKKGYHPPFRWFADIKGSFNFIEDIVEDHKESEIRKDPNWMINFQNACQHFQQKNGFSVIDGTEKIALFEEVKKTLKNIKIHGKAF